MIQSEKYETETFTSIRDSLLPKLMSGEIRVPIETSYRMSFPGNNRLQPGSYYHSRGYLPHFDIPEAIQHVTYHLADSLPREVLERTKEGESGQSGDWRSGSTGQSGAWRSWKENGQAGAWRSGGETEQSFRIWHREYWDRFIRDLNDFETVVYYIHENPVKAGLVAKAEEWLWSSAGKLGQAGAWRSGREESV